MQQRLLSLSLVSLFGWLGQSGCAGPDVPVFDVTDRVPGVRAPRSASCDDQDPTRCLLPFPSNVFTVKDAQTKTGLRVAVQSQELVGGDDAAALNRADGFSLVTPIVTAFAASVSPLPVAKQGEGSLRVLLAQPDAADFHLVSQHGNRVRAVIPNTGQRMRSAYAARIAVINKQHSIRHTFLDDLLKLCLFVGPSGELRIREFH